MYITFGGLNFTVSQKWLRWFRRQKSYALSNENDEPWELCDIYDVELPHKYPDVDDNDSEHSYICIYQPHRHPPRFPRSAITVDPVELNQRSQHLPPCEKTKCEVVGLYSSCMREISIHHGLRRDFAVQRGYLRSIANELLEVIKPPSIPAKLSSSTISQDRDTLHQWRSLEKVFTLLGELDRKLDLSDQNLRTLERQLQQCKTIDHSHCVVPSQQSVASIRISKPDAGSNSSSSGPSTLQEYYRQASAVRYLSMELNNLGPKPVEASLPDSQHEFVESFDPFDGTPLTPQQYAHRQNELIKELQHARAEEARLRKICEELGLELEEDDNDGDEQRREMLAALETGPARIDAELAKSAAFAHDEAPIQQENLIVEWVNDVERSISVPSRSDGPLDFEEQHLAVPQSRCSTYDQALLSPTRCYGSVSPRRGGRRHVRRHG